MTIIEVLAGVLATAGLFAWFGAGFGVHQSRKDGAGVVGCASCPGGCSGGGCVIQDREEPS